LPLKIKQLAGNKFPDYIFIKQLKTINMLKFLALLASFTMLILGFTMTNIDLPINQYQFIGSHNSYKEYIDPKLIKLIEKADTSRSLKGIEYHHIGLSEQLNLGLRALEIDIAADEKGGKYAHPKGLDWAGKQATRPYDTEGVMNEAGFKVLHIQDIDFRSNCLTFKQCLKELKQWSNAHPDHEPIFITMNAKDDTINKPDFVVPEKFTATVFDQLDKALLDHLGLEKIITPDAVRGKFATLEEAVLKNGWMKRSQAKGHFIFILDENKEKTTYYTQNHPALKGRVMFTNAPVGTPEAAILIMNDPLKEGIQIKENVKKGYIVRTRADADTREARTNDYSRFKAAQESGAQIISTDYYVKSTLFPSEYMVSFEGKTYFKKNPLF
jgi:Phosphoinositide phospholipase C, Ca2+-dependent